MQYLNIKRKRLLSCLVIPLYLVVFQLPKTTKAYEYRGEFECLVTDSKRFYHGVYNDDTEWNEENFLSIEQFKIEYGLIDDTFVIHSMDHDNAPINSINIPTLQDQVDYYIIQYSNYANRVTLRNLNLGADGKILNVETLMFDQGYISVETHNGELSLTKSPNGRWLGINHTIWKGKRPESSSIYLIFLDCSHNLNILDDLMNRLYDRGRK